jgi:hypothetical protein
LNGFPVEDKSILRNQADITEPSIHISRIRYVIQADRAMARQSWCSDVEIASNEICASIIPASGRRMRIHITASAFSQALNVLLI